MLVSWGDFDRHQIVTFISDDEVGQRVCACYRNALPTVRQWLKKMHPEITLDKTWSGKHRLCVYAEIVGFKVPRRYGQGVAAKGIRLLREGLAGHGSYDALPDETKKAWKNVRGHNRLDCLGAREIVQLASVEYWPAEVSD